MTTVTTWGHVHAGDTVRGADQRTWVVCGRHARAPWLLDGERARFALRHGERVVSVERRLADPAPVVQPADHRATAAAVDVLVHNGLDVELVEETMTTSQPDAFTAAAPRTQVRRDRWQRYLLPDPATGVERAWTRVSTVARTLADEYLLTAWKMRMVAKGLALRPDLVAGAAAADPDADRSTLDSIAQQAMDRAEAGAGANFGTALHSFTQRLDRGEPLASLGAPPPLDADLAVYVAALRAAMLGVVAEHVERIVVAPELGVAGTLDRIVTQPAGHAKAAPLSVLDLKTARNISFGWLEIAVQQALYAHATHMWDPATASYVPMPAVDQARALVLHLPVGQATAQVYGVDILKGWQLAQVALTVRAARSAARNLAWLVKPDDRAAVALHNVSRAASREELATLWDRLHPQGLWTEEVNAAALARHAELQAAQPATA